MPDPRGERGGIERTLGWFALVAYIPDPLGRFLDDLRTDLSPACNPRAHITVLPPRPHAHNLSETIASIRETIGVFRSFPAELGKVRIFDVSNVVYIDLARGAAELRNLYRAVSRGPLAFTEDFAYQPHITIAQQLDRPEAIRIAALSRERWARYTGPRIFEVSKLTFVQHVAPSIWADVATISTREAPAPDCASEADASEPSPAHFEEVFQPR